MFLNNRKSCSTFQDCSLALGFLFTLQEFVFFYLLPREALKGTYSKWELGRSDTVFSNAHPLLRWRLGTIRGLPWEANTDAAVLLTPGNTKGSRGWRLQNYNTSGTGRWQRQGRYSTGMLESHPAATFISVPFCSPLGLWEVKSHIDINLLMQLFVTILWLHQITVHLTPSLPTEC